MTFQLLTSIIGGETPLYHDLLLVTFPLPGLRFSLQYLHITNATIQTLLRQSRKVYLG